MTLQSLYNNMWFVIGASYPALWGASQNAATLNAAWESCALIWRIFLEGGPGSKTISSSWGEIHRVSWTTTFANAGTTLRVWIQDVWASGIEDGTFDVYADLVWWTDVISSNSLLQTPMETWSKTITHGDIVAITAEMVSRWGTDSVILTWHPSWWYNFSLFPYATVDSGSWPAKTTTMSVFIIEFDDWTLWWIEFWPRIDRISGFASFSYNSSSSPDEYAALFKVPFKCEVNGGALGLGGVATTDAFEMILYSDPLWTPVAEATEARDPFYIGSTANAIVPHWARFSTPYTLMPNTWYALAARPTTTNSISFWYRDFGSGWEKFKKPWMLGTNIKVAWRTNQSWAFVETQNYHLPIFRLSVSKLDDWASLGWWGWFFIQ